MEKEAIEQLLDSNDIEDNILGLIISDSLGMEIGKPEPKEGLTYCRVYRREWTHLNPSVYGGLIINMKHYWINSYGIFELTDTFKFGNEPILYDDGSIKEYQEYP